MPASRETAACTAAEEVAPHIAEVGREALETIRRLNEGIFGEEHVIETFDRADLVMLVAELEGEPVGFKIGYRALPDAFYSAKGGVLSAYRRRGIARRLLHALMDCACRKGYRRFVYDTFPNLHPGMAVLGLVEGFRVTRADYSTEYEDYRLRLEKEL